MSRLPRGLLGGRNTLQLYLQITPTAYSELRIQILATRNQYMLKLLHQYTRLFISRLSWLLRGKCSLSILQPCHVVWVKSVKRSSLSYRDDSLCLQPWEMADPLTEEVNRTCDQHLYLLISVRKCIMLIWKLILRIQKTRLLQELLTQTLEGGIYHSKICH